MKYTTVPLYLFAVFSSNLFPKTQPLADHLDNLSVSQSLLHRATVLERRFLRNTSNSTLLIINTKVDPKNIF